MTPFIETIHDASANGEAAHPWNRIFRKVDKNAKYTIQVSLHPHQSIYACSKLLVGLLRLEARGVATVRFVVGRSDELHPCVLMMEIVRDDDVSCRLGIDVQDRSDQIILEMLDNLDVYFKRSYDARDVRALRPDRQRKMLPSGPYFPCGVSGLSARILRSMGLEYWLRFTYCAVCDRERFLDDRHILSQFLFLPSAEEYETGPADKAEPIILFQTRVWEQRHVSNDDVTEINEGRAALVRALRREFGERFHGGIVPTPFALKYFPDVITSLPHRRAEYIAMSKPASIGISTRGLHHSTPFKLGEYLASSKAIVSEPIRHQLYVPLREGVNYMNFSGPDECVAQCAQLLSDPARTARMREANHRYYIEQTEPSAAVANCIERAFEELGSFAKDQWHARPIQ